MELMTPHVGTIFWTTVTFILLLFFLKKLAWGPIINMLEEREERIRTSLEQAKENQKQAEELAIEREQIIELARTEAQDIVASARLSADQARASIIKDAQSEAEKVLERAKKEIHTSRDRAIADIQSMAVELSMAATEKMIRKHLDKKEHERVVDDSIKRMESIR